MNDQDLLDKMIDYIRTTYKADYNGLLKVKKENNQYTIIIGIPSYMFPTLIAGEFEDDESFLNFAYEEFRVRNYIRQDYYKVIRLDKEGIIPTPSTETSYKHLI